MLWLRRDGASFQKVSRDQGEGYSVWILGGKLLSIYFEWLSVEMNGGKLTAFKVLS